MQARIFFCLEIKYVWFLFTILLSGLGLSACNPYQAIMTSELLERAATELGTPMDEALICPDLEAMAHEAHVGHLTLRHGESLSKQTLAGGQADLANCHKYEGFTSIKPDMGVDYAGPSSESLVFEVESSIDTMLFVQVPSGEILFDDDSGEGRDGRLSIEDPVKGTYLVWVGVGKKALAYDETVSVFLSAF